MTQWRKDWKPPAKGYYSLESPDHREFDAIDVLHWLKRQETALRDCKDMDDGGPRYRIFNYGNYMGYASAETVKNVLEFFSLSGFIE